MKTIFKCDLLADTDSFPHFWEHTIGSGHAPLGLRSDWQKQLKRCHDELGFKHVRFHGILSDDMGTLMNENNQLVYSFFNADQICDFLLSIGMKPFMELSFMPDALASGSNRVFHYRGNITPPRSYDEWRDFIHTIVQHWVQRYGLEMVQEWYFEIWNEPNLSAFWLGTQDEYFKLYGTAAEAIKKIDPTLRVGGPATAANEWIPEFTEYCKKESVPCDFISTHHYPTDSFGKPGDDTISQLAASKRSILRDQVINTRKQAGFLPVYYTEWCTSSNPFDDLHDEPYAAAFIIKTIMEAHGQVQGYSYWTFSDIFEENYFSSVPFHGGFGLLTIHGIPKPSYRAFELLHGLGDKIYLVEGSHPTVDVWITKSASSVMILITNWALPRHDIKEEIIQITLLYTRKISKAFVERIDDEHSNATTAWRKLQKPQYLNHDQVETLESASSLLKEILSYSSDGSSVRFDIGIPIQGTARITLLTT